jgi:hypothetical protein
MSLVLKVVNVVDAESYEPFSCRGHKPEVYTMYSSCGWIEVGDFRYFGFFAWLVSVISPVVVHFKVEHAR